MKTLPPSSIGRLLAELSWEGGKITDYRSGGRGYENVLTAEVLQALDFLPRTAFLGAVIRGAHGDLNLLQDFSLQVERMNVSVLPGDMTLQAEDIPKKHVQPDAIFSSESFYCLVEAKRIGNNSFQKNQLAREFVMARTLAEARRPVLFLILSDAPPVKVKGCGKLSIEEAISSALPDVFEEGTHTDHLNLFINQSVIWTTWDEIAKTVKTALGSYTPIEDSSLRSITRIADSLLQAIEWHEIRA